MRKTVIVGNWKMNLTLEESMKLASELCDFANKATDIEIGIAPVAPFIGWISTICQNQALGLSAQNAHWENAGAFTGEFSMGQLKQAGCQYVILGHSERRQFFGETDIMVGKKARAAHDHDLTPIICVGETLAERDAGLTISKVLEQVEQGFSLLNQEECIKSICAYEPVWAIGTGRNATPAQAQAVHLAIRQKISAMYGQSVADQLRIQYGGSVKADNISTLLSEPDIDGALVGGASIKADSFIALLKNARFQNLN
jgi:triosephosphate isomerase